MIRALKYLLLQLSPAHFQVKVSCAICKYICERAKIGSMATLPSKAMDTFPNPRPERDYEINMDCPEFTCLCPRTGQPDFATIRINYVPDKVCVELKSLKLYFGPIAMKAPFMRRSSTNSRRLGASMPAAQNDRRRRLQRARRHPYHGQSRISQACIEFLSGAHRQSAFLRHCKPKRVAAVERRVHRRPEINRRVSV